MAYVSFNPWTQNKVAEYPETTPADILDILEKVAVEWVSWHRTPVSKRSQMLDTLAIVLGNHRTELAVMMAEEMGKPVKQGFQEIDKCALLCRYYASNAETLLSPEKRPSAAGNSIVFFEPQGIILGIMPWNFPLWQVFRFAVPNLAGGNSVLLKHASNVPRCAEAIEKLIREAGFPDSVFRTIFPSHSQVMELISSPLVRGVSLTGSNGAGSRIASEAGKHIKKVVMELGGSDPFIVLADADLEKAAEAAVISRFQNCGQSCIAAKRILVAEPAYSTFRDIFVAMSEELVTGNPLDGTTDVGPMVSVAAADELDKQLTRTLKAGARLLCGGRDNTAGPAIFLPSVVENVPALSPLSVEETFGPVAPLFRFRSVDEAVRIANNTSFGLGASVWTTDHGMAMDIAHRIETGTVAVNGFVRSEPGLPFGGVKASGFGRELSAEGLREFLNVKTVTFY